jgi:enoyl-CoA hydratase
MNAETLVIVEHPLSGCALVTLNRPRAMNALSSALRAELVAALNRLSADPSVRVLVLTGAGKAFCAGLDLKELGAGSEAAAALVPTEALDPVAALARFAGPIIGAVNGAAITGGFELALACDVLIASAAASFADTHARVGVMPGWGLSQRLPRIIGASRAKELSLSGNFLSAQRAEAWGLVNRVVEPDQLLPQALALASDMLSALPEMLPAYKRLIDDGLATTLERGLAIEKNRSREWAAGIDSRQIEARRAHIAQRGRDQSSTASD